MDRLYNENFQNNTLRINCCYLNKIIIIREEKIAENFKKKKKNSDEKKSEKRNLGKQTYLQKVIWLGSAGHAR